MTKALFVFTGIVYENENRYYTVNLTSEVFHKLYFPYCDKLVVCQRLKHTTNVSGLTEVRSTDIEYSCPPYSSSPLSMYFVNRNKYFKFIEELVKTSDFVIERPGLLGCAAAKYAKKYNKPCVCEVVGNIFASFWHHSLFGKVLAPFREMDTRKTVRDSKYTIYVTQKYLQRQYPSNGKCIGISDVEIDKLDNIILENRILKIDQYEKGYVYKMTTVAGVNARAKGQIYALKAVKKLKEKGIKIDYYLVGEGDQTYLKKKAEKYGISEQVFFTGAMPHQKVYEFLIDMDLYIQPSLHEGLPRAVVEAMSRALPCLGSRTAGIPELIPNEMVFEKKNVDQICNIIEGLTKENLKKYATISFKRAKDFEQESLKKKRDIFFKEFLLANSLSS